MDLYAETRLNGGLTSQNYYTSMEAAADEIGVPLCLWFTRFPHYKVVNGIGN